MDNLGKRLAGLPDIGNVLSLTISENGSPNVILQAALDYDVLFPDHMVSLYVRECPNVSRL